MKITIGQYQKIAHCFPKPRKKPNMNNLEVLNALLYVLDNGCKWRPLPSEFGK
jgi:transposase